MTRRPISIYRLERAAGRRCGVVPPVHRTVPTASDLPRFHNVAIPREGSDAWASASGGLHPDPDEATAGAIAEALERYNGAMCVLPLVGGDTAETHPHRKAADFALFSRRQYARPDFPFQDPDSDPDRSYVGMYSLFDNNPMFIPQILAGIGPRKPGPPFPSTSTGLSAHTTRSLALLRGVQELLERDALTVTWLNSLPGKPVEMPPHLVAEVGELGGKIEAYDLTQCWNPMPVILVCGSLPQRGRPRISLGCACRASRAEALDKAFREWVQGVIFCGHYDANHPRLNPDPLELAPAASFEEHAAYYTLKPALWAKVPLRQRRTMPAPAPDSPIPPQDAFRTLEESLPSLRRAGVEVFYRDMTLPDVRDAGIHVVRTVSPQLSLIHSDDRIPFLGGRTLDFKWRYPDAEPCAKIPNPFPHPLG